MAQQSQRRKRKDERSTEDGVAWNSFGCKWLECGTTNCKMWMSMLVPDEVDMEHEVVKCGVYIVKKMNVVKGEKELLRKEVGELKEKVEELRVQSINKDKEVAEVKTKEEDSWAIVAKEMKSHNVFERLEKVESDMIIKKSVIRKEVKSTNEEETKKKRILIFNLKNKTGKSDVECVKDVFGKMGTGQSCDDVMDVVTRYRQ